jgi:HK97 family phage major capsid protein
MSYANVQLSDNLKNYIKAQFDELSQAEIENKRGHFFKLICDEIAKNNNNVVDLTKAISIYFHLDREFAEELSWLRSRKDNGYLEKAYKRFYEGRTDADVEIRAANPLAGDNVNINDTLLSDTIILQSRMESAIFDFIRYFPGEGYQDVKIPVYRGYLAATKKLKNQALDDFTDDTTGGLTSNYLSHIIIQPYKLGFTFDIDAEGLFKLRPTIISQLIDQMVASYTAGMLNDIYFGNGTAPQSLGMFTNATNVTAASTIEATLTKVFTELGKKVKSDTRGYFIATNLAGATYLATRKLMGEAYNNNVQLNGKAVAGTTLGVPVLVDPAIPVTTSNGNEFAPLLVGFEGHYCLVESAKPKVETDAFANIKTGLQTVRVMGIMGGKPAFNDSFVKTSIQL